MKIKQIEISIYRIPTDRPEADGTFHWDSTTLVLVEAVADSGLRGMGFSYTAAAAGELIHERLAEVLMDCPVEHIGAAWEAMVRTVRNVGLPGLAATAISAVDTALWDLRARAEGLALFHLLGAYRDSVPIYGSGGFTTYSEGELIVKQAIGLARRFHEQGVIYFEEPVPFDHLDQLAFIRQQSPIAIASGEYGYSPYDFHNVLKAGAVDILQADATRCLGITGCLQAAAMAYAFGIPFSTHTAPMIHAHIGCAVPQIEHLEYFYDHVRIENMLFEGVLQPQEGYLHPDPSRPGLGLELKTSDAERWKL
jgi:L-alanine-DL-glutamate epimerase-like enolase superfamily enzyme